MSVLRRNVDPELAELLGRFGEVVLRSGRLMRSLLDDYPEHASLAHEIAECEQEGDRITHDVIYRIRGARRVRAPFDAGEGFALATALDDILDHTEQAAALLGLYGVEAPMERAVELADVLVDAGAEVVEALRCLTTETDPGGRLVEIHRLENLGDTLLRDGVASLFAGGADPMVVIRWKDIFESLEAAIDACETVAHVIEGITLRARR
ncbi:MAG TPA: DUF47 family protein [Solirubrobacteraceae bacterium]|jgi:uncharacterized protein Yka (UPF0111/DUF47 family)